MTAEKHKPSKNNWGLEKLLQNLLFLLRVAFYLLHICLIPPMSGMIGYRPDANKKYSHVEENVLK